MDLFACTEFLTSTRVCSTGSCGQDFQKQHRKSAFPVWTHHSSAYQALPNPPFLCHILCFGHDHEAALEETERRNILTLILYCMLQDRCLQRYGVSPLQHCALVEAHQLFPLQTTLFGCGCATEKWRSPWNAFERHVVTFCLTLWQIPAAQRAVGLHWR